MGYGCGLFQCARHSRHQAQRSEASFNLQEDSDERMARRDPQMLPSIYQAVAKEELDRQCQQTSATSIKAGEMDPPVIFEETEGDDASSSTSSTNEEQKAKSAGAALGHWVENPETGLPEYVPTDEGRELSARLAALISASKRLARDGFRQDDDHGQDGHSEHQSKPGM